MDKILFEISNTVRAEKILSELNENSRSEHRNQLIKILSENPPKGFDNGTNGVTNTWWHYAHSVEGFDFLHKNIRYGMSITKLRGAFFGFSEADEKMLMGLNKKNNGWFEMIEYIRNIK